MKVVFFAAAVGVALCVSLGYYASTELLVVISAFCTYGIGVLWLFSGHEQRFDATLVMILTVNFSLFFCLMWGAHVFR